MSENRDPPEPGLTYIFNEVLDQELQELFEKLDGATDTALARFRRCRAAPFVEPKLQAMLDAYEAELELWRRHMHMASIAKPKAHAMWHAYYAGLAVEQARKVLAKEQESGADAERALQQAVATHLAIARRTIAPPPKHTKYATRLCERNGMEVRDTVAVDVLAGLGEEGSTLREKGLVAAQIWADGAAEAWRIATSEEPEDWLNWSAADRWLERFALQLSWALWHGEVRAQVEKAREHQKDAAPVRHPTDLITTTAIARLYGGKIDGGNILVTPPRGLTLALPFNGELSVSDRYGGMVGLRQVLPPIALQIHLGALVLYQDAGGRDDGSFEMDGNCGAILDVIGATQYANRKGEHTYFDFDSRDRRCVKRYFGDVFPQLRVRRVGDIEAKGGDALVDELDDRRNGRRRFYAHARLIVAELRNNFTQIPRAVCKLRSDDVPIALGIAVIVRQKALAYLKNKKPIEAEVGTWLESCGIDATGGSRKEGLSFWPRVADRLVRVAEDGKLGRMTKVGEGHGLVLALEPEATLRAAYHPLLDSAKAHEKAKREARVRAQRPSRGRIPRVEGEDSESRGGGFRESRGRIPRVEGEG